MKTIIVTGASGFIGKYVVEKFLKEKYKVIGISRNCVASEKKHLEMISVDICDYNDVETKLVGHDIEGIIHLAADISIPGNEKTLFTNTVGTYNLFQWANENRIQYFINLSSVPIIGKPQRIPIDEQHRIQPMTIYHLSKFLSECLLNETFSDSVRVLNIRIPSPIGVGMNSKNFLSVVIRKCFMNEKITIFGKGSRIQNYIDVRDIADGIYAAVNCQASGLILFSGTSISNMQLTEKCKDIIKSSSEIVLNGKNDVEEQNQWIIDGRKASKLLGFEPRYDLDSTIKWILDGIDK